MIIPPEFRKTCLEEITEAVGELWLRGITDAEIDDFIVWAAKCQVYFGDCAQADLGDAFRGFVKGCFFHVDAKARGVEI